MEVSAAGVARHYGARSDGGLLDGWLVDTADAGLVEEIDGALDQILEIDRADAPLGRGVGARELAPDNVRVNAICPGFIATDITAGKLTDEMRATINAGIPMGRPGTADEVAGCALFLASDISSYVTGSEVDVNGGSLIH